jgi:Protein of unknown function (DUF3551)
MMMRSAILALLAIASISAIGSSPATALEYPYCVQSPIDSADCAYSSYNQCMATASGHGGVCIVNPSVAFAQQYPQRQRPRRVRRTHDY